MFGLSEKNAVARATLKANGRDDEMTREIWAYKFRQLRSGQYKDYVTEAERPEVEEKKRLETERQRAMIYKDSDVELSLHINFNE